MKEENHEHNEHHHDHEQHDHNQHQELHHHEGHNHSHDVSHISGGRLFLVILLNLIITISEIIGGVISGSLSLISDAMHNLSDTAAIALSYFSIRISLKPKNKTKTYGYKRANILSAFIT